MSLIRLSRNSVILLISPAIAIALFGVLLDLVSLGRYLIHSIDYIPPATIFGYSRYFFVPIAISNIIFAFLLTWLIHITNLKERFPIISLSIFVMFLNMVIVVYLGGVLTGIAGEFYFLVYGIGILPALIAGVVYGMIIHSRLIRR